MLSGGQEFRHFPGQGLPVATGGQDNEAVPLGEPLLAGIETVRAIPDFAQADVEYLLKGGKETVGNHVASAVTGIWSGHNSINGKPGRRCQGN